MVIKVNEGTLWELEDPVQKLVFERRKSMSLSEVQRRPSVLKCAVQKENPETKALMSVLLLMPCNGA
jgi:hypothetical protein